ncbi:MAG TPA: histone deacetylase [Thermoanaerobaculia bacterium]|nr:histone deacetylase [Thermoanaerobaculia bacterium]
MLRLLTSPIFQRHDTGVGHPESSARIAAALEGIERAGLSGSVRDTSERHPETLRMIRKVHDPRYEREFEDACGRGGRLFHSVDNPISNGSHAAATEAVSLTLHAADEIWQDNSADRAFIVARPPGHHAERATAMGFCFFNTIACAAQYLLERPGIDRVLIFDFDVHHGNGTQNLFESRDDVFYTSVHRFPFYPGTGASTEIGSGAGRGFTRNFPLDQGGGDSVYLESVEHGLLPLIDQYRPHAILLSSGFDAHARDPLGGMRLTAAGFGEITRLLVEAAAKTCDGRILSLLEGGYDKEGLASSVAEHVQALE